MTAPSPLGAVSDATSPNADLHSALAEARAAYAAGNPASAAQHTAAARSLPGGNTRTVLFAEPFPLTLDGGSEAEVWDLDGHRYVDFLGEYTAGLFGHSHPVIRGAIDRALAGGINLGGHNPLESRFAEAVCARFPSIELVRFTNSGTEANLLAVATACAVTGRRKIMTLAGGYHGSVFYFGAANNPLNAPYDFVTVPYNDVAAVEQALAAHGPELAAIIVEPMLGGGGCIAAEMPFLRALRAGAAQCGAILIFDEVMTSRLAPGGLQEATGVVPDMTTLGKYIGGGMSFGAFGGSADIMARFDPHRADAFPHAGTFNNNALTMAAGLAGLTEIYTPAVNRALNARGDALRDRLNGLFAAADAAMVATGLGSMMTIHMRRGPIRNAADAAASNAALRELFYFDLTARGIWLARRGMINLSLPITDAHCDLLVDAVADFLGARRSLVAI